MIYPVIINNWKGHGEVIKIHWLKVLEPIGGIRLKQTGCVLSGSVCCVLSLCCYWPSTSLLSASLFIPFAHSLSFSFTIQNIISGVSISDPDSNEAGLN